MSQPAERASATGRIRIAARRRVGIDGICTLLRRLDGIAVQVVPPLTVHKSRAIRLELPRESQNHELRGSDRRHSDLDDKASVVDIILRHRAAIALDVER